MNRIEGARGAGFVRQQFSLKVACSLVALVAALGVAAAQAQTSTPAEKPVAAKSKTAKAPAPTSTPFTYDALGATPKVRAPGRASAAAPRDKTPAPASGTAAPVAPATAANAPAATDAAAR